MRRQTHGSVDLKKAVDRERERMRRQGVIGWVILNDETGLVLHLYQTLRNAQEVVPGLNERHHVAFEVLGVNGSGEVYRQIEGRLTERARDRAGNQLRIPLKGRRINAASVRRHVSA